MRSDELVLVRVGRGGRARRNIQLGENVAHVPVDGLLAQGQLGGDRLVRLAGGDEAQHLQLARRQPMVAMPDGARRGERVECARGPAPRPTVRIRFGQRRTRVAPPRRRRGRGTPVPSARARVRPCMAPRSAATLRGAPQWTERGLRIAVGQLDRASRMGGHRTQHVGVEALRDVLQLAAGAARFLDIAAVSMIST